MLNKKTVTTPAPLRAYIDRIGAEELNFRRFMVRIYRGAYYTEKVLVRITEEGDVIVSDKAYAPTKDEALQIKGAVMATEYPRAVRVGMTMAKRVEKEGGVGDKWYYLVDREDGQVIMVQQRTKAKDGTKIFVPWTHWSDGEWRRMEPDGALPFWKPEKSRGRARIMVHEGAKAAAAADAISVAKKSDHPWAEELGLYEHWGIIGGALAPHRADYAELRRENAVEVVYVCDNDFAGKAVLQDFSRLYAGPLQGVMFDGRWEVSWDVADPIPKDMFVDGKYRGPTLRSLLIPATWATDHVITGERGKPTTVLTRSFREEWMHSVVPEVFIHKDHPGRMNNAAEFNSVVRPFSHVDDTARLVRADQASKSVVIKYDPAAPPGIFADEERFINTYTPPTILPEEGDAGPWLEFMARLIPRDDDRLGMLNWVATLIARPEVKMAYGILLVSEAQGVGKGTLGEKILAPLIGMPNVSFPSESDIVDSAYNYWLSHKRLAIVHEIYAGHSSKAYNKLKSVITDKFVTVSRKYLANYEVENWIHVFACSNSSRALLISADDRRWYVPEVTDDKADPGYWTKFNRWLVRGGGLGIIRQWADEYIAKHGAVEAGMPAPWSSGKTEVIEEGYSPGMELVSAFLGRLKQEAGDDRLIVVDRDLVRLIQNCLHEGRQSDKLERPLTIRKVARTLGFFVGKHKIPMSTRWGEGRPSASGVMILSRSEDILADPVSLAKEGVIPVHVEKKAKEWGFWVI